MDALDARTLASAFCRYLKDMSNANYLEYTEQALADFASYSDEQKYLLVNAVTDLSVEKVLDVGCGAGQQLLPFAEKKDSFCVGIDIAEEVGQVGKKVFEKAGFAGKGDFICSIGESLPFADESFDVVICRVALPYMDNRKAIGEISRVLKPNGKFFLKTHSPFFYLWSFKERLKMMSIKHLIYPIICLTGGTINLLSGKHPQGNFWKGKEVYQTKGFLEREFAKNGLKIIAELADSKITAPSYLIEKNISMSSYLTKLKQNLPWMVRYPFSRAENLFSNGNGTKKHLIFTVANHFEPAWHQGGAYDLDTQRRRLDEYHITARKTGEAVRDADGTKFRHTNFYPAEQYYPQLLETMAAMQAEGLGDVEIHLHHGVEEPDTAENLRKVLVDFRDVLAEKHKCLSRIDGDGNADVGVCSRQFSLGKFMRWKVLRR